MQELCVIFVVMVIAAFVSIYPCLTAKINAENLSQTFAQILAEIVAIIFVLPQVIVQLTLKPQRKDIRAVFSGFIPFYFLYYIAAIVILASTYLDVFFSNGDQTKNIVILFTFFSSVLLIIPYLLFLIKEYSTSENIFNIKKKKILKKIKRILKVNVPATNNHHNNRQINVIEKEVLDLVIELKDYILTYSKEGYNFFSGGVNTLAELIENSYDYKNPIIDNLTLEILEAITEFGLKIESDAYKSKLNERLAQTAEIILLSNEPVNRINLFVTKIILALEKNVTEGSIYGSGETVRKSIALIHHISLVSLRHKPPILLEYHLFAESFKRICIFSIKRSYDNCARDVLEDLGYMVELSLKVLPVNHLPIYKICDVLTDIGILASKGKHEVFCIQCVNRIASIIIDIKNQKLSIEIQSFMASLLELIANIWVNFEELDKWLYNRLINLRRDDKIDFRKYIKPTADILESKSLVSKAIFSDFVDSLNDFNEQT